MSVARLHSANAGAAHFAPESFDDFAFGEISAAPYWTLGICFNPLCGRAFSPTRDWSKYCSARCREQTNAEMKRWGHRFAVPLFVWRLGKYEAKDEAVRARTNAARRYISQIQTAWLHERRANLAGAFHV